MAIDRLGPYRIERLIGRGGMGVVYAATHTESSERVAVKVLSSVLAADPRFRSRFTTEIETLKKLHHPHIVRLLGYGEDEGHVFYSMELVEGQNLQEELRAGRRFHWREVARMGVQICQALKHAHDHGVIHRDLKPANLLLTDDEIVKLTDFGIARLFGASQHTTEGSVLGTADYMAPEQADNRPVTARTDLYSLGGVFYALLTGRPPFPGKTVLEVLERLRHEEPPLVRQLAPEVPEEFEQIVRELLQKDPTKRVATPQILAKRLKSMDFALSVDTRVVESRDPLVSDLHDISEHVRITNLSFHDDSDAAEIAELPTIQVTDESEEANPAAPRASGRTPAAAPPKDPLDDNTVVSPKRGNAAAANDGPRPASFTVVDGGDRDPGSSDSATTGWTTSVAAAGLMVGLVVVLVGSAWAIWRTLQPTPIDELYDQIAVAREAGPDELRQASGAIDEFVRRAPGDPRMDEVTTLRTDVEVLRAQRRLELLARQKGPESLATVEQAFLVALRAKQSNRSLARDRFQQMVDVFGQLEGESDQVNAIVKLARHELSRLGDLPSPPNADNSGELEKRLERAEKELEPEQFRRFLTGVIGLYEGQPWATQIVAECQKKLQHLAP